MMIDTVTPSNDMSMPDLEHRRFKQLYVAPGAKLTGGGNFPEWSITQPQYAGQIEIAPGVLVSMTAMPNRFRRWMNRLFFGYTYHDWSGWAN